MREKCKNHAITIILIKSKHQKILGGYSQTEWIYTEKKDIPSNSSFIFFYEDDKLRKCAQKNVQCDIRSNNSWI